MGIGSFFPNFTRLVSGRAGIRICVQTLHLTASYTASQGWGFKMGCVPPLCPEEPIMGYRLELLRVTQTEQKVQVRAGMVAKQSLGSLPSAASSSAQVIRQVGVLRHSLIAANSHTACTHTGVMQ